MDYYVLYLSIHHYAVIVLSLLVTCMLPLQWPSLPLPYIQSSSTAGVHKNSLSSLHSSTPYTPYIHYKPSSTGQMHTTPSPVLSATYPAAVTATRTGDPRSTNTVEATVLSPVYNNNTTHVCNAVPSTYEFQLVAAHKETVKVYKFRV